ncbi:uncharacterized protein LOC143493338 [Brachyhypopomus gauderio]|uniref:uncharacterized protein LOC143493338 n=1 Tax=Brachyhypopomus gauderio TaxID=698409 RepID=UPI004042E8A1
MEWGTLLCCLSVSVLSASAFVNKTIHNIEELKTVEFGHNYPRHGLLLLHWLADHVSITSSGGILLQFDPARLDFGFRRYANVRNNEKMQVFPQWNGGLDRVYYSVGSLSSESTRTQLPPYVTQDFYNAPEDPNRDLDRIVVQVHRDSPLVAEKVFISQAENRSVCDPDKTYEISPKLLRQVQALEKPLDTIHILELYTLGSVKSTGINPDDPRLTLSQDKLLDHMTNADKRLQTIFEQPSVRWLLSVAGYDIDHRYSVHQKTWSCSTNETDQDNPHTLCEGKNTVKIEVKSSPNGYARLTWSGIPKNIIDMKPTLVLFTSDTSLSLLTFEDLKGRTSGSENTIAALNHGLHPRLISYGLSTEYGFFGIRYSVIWRGPQFDAANRVVPTKISGYSASLQLYTTDGYACARLYIRKSFTGWRGEFQNSWVGFYSSKQDRDDNYKHFQWVSRFERAGDEDNANIVYEYQSSMSIGPGVQARFVFSRDNVPSHYLLGWFPPTALASTIPWEDE